jgi:hypothetical protein
MALGQLARGILKSARGIGANSTLRFEISTWHWGRLRVAFGWGAKFVSNA